MSAYAAKISNYTKTNVETASQGKLVVMLFNGAIQRAEEAKRQIEKGRLQEVHNNLVRAQEIMGELRGALNMQAGEIATNLDRIYEFCQHLLIKANVQKSPAPIEDAVRLMTDMRDTWEEAFKQAAAEAAGPAPQINTHGHSCLNVRG